MLWLKCFEALTSERLYKRTWTPKAARDHLIAEQGKHFDPRCVDAFLSCWDEVLVVRMHGERFLAASASSPHLQPSSTGEKNSSAWTGCRE